MTGYRAFHRATVTATAAAQHLGHRFRSVALLAALASLLAALGAALAGSAGLVVTALIAAVLLASSRSLPVAALCRLYGARPLDEFEAARLYRLLVTLSRRAGLRFLPRLYYLPSRDRNAFTLGRRDQAAIVVTDGLLRALAPRELDAVLAHEVSHVKHEDTWLMTVAGIATHLTRLLSSAVMLLLLLSLPLAVLGQAPLPLAAVALAAVAPGLSVLLQLALSRSREFEADLSAVALTGDPHGLASALRKLEGGGRWLAWLLGRRPPRLPAWLRTHPETDARIDRLRSLAAGPELSELRLPQRFVVSLG